MRHLFIVGALLSIAGTAYCNTCEDRALNILLTNDDGYTTPGIVALHKALQDAGHNVKRIAPAENFSGSSASLTIAAISATPIEDEHFRYVYAVSGSPATTVLLGASIFFSDAEPLDLVVSGINQGANLGPAANFSGTVGATIAAQRALVPAVPAIAVSTTPANRDPDSKENLQLVERIGGFIARLVGHLQTTQCEEGSLLPSGMALNINYPGGTLKGVRIAHQGTAPIFSIGFTAIGDDRYAPQFGDTTGDNDVANSDTVLYNSGFVTIVPIDGDLTTPADVSTPVLTGVEAIAP